MLERLLDHWSIVLVGHWNVMIFTPQWVGDRLFGGSPIETLVPIGPGLPLIFQGPHSSVQVSGSRLEVRPRAATESDFAKAEELARLALTTLADTPVSAVGINLVFRESAPPDELVQLFNFKDGGELQSAGFSASERRIVRQFPHADRKLNLTLRFTGAAVVFEFNFHHDADGAAAAAMGLTGRAANFLTDALALLDNVYHLNTSQSDN